MLNNTIRQQAIIKKIIAKILRQMRLISLRVTANKYAASYLEITGVSAALEQRLLSGHLNL
jgi:hypothetical protein